MNDDNIFNSIIFVEHIFVVKGGGGEGEAGREDKLPNRKTEQVLASMLNKAQHHHKVQYSATMELNRDTSKNSGSTSHIKTERQLLLDSFLRSRSRLPQSTTLPVQSESITRVLFPIQVPSGYCYDTRKQCTLPYNTVLIR